MDVNSGYVLRFHGDFSCFLYLWNQYTDRDANEFRGDLYRLDIHTGETEYLTQIPGKPFVVDEKRVYHSGTENVMTFDLETGETDVLLNTGPAFLTLDGDRLYVDNSFYVWLFASDDYTQRTVTVINTNTLEALAVFPLTIHKSDFAGTCGSHVLADTTREYYRGDLNAAMSGADPEWEHFNPKAEEGAE